MSSSCPCRLYYVLKLPMSPVLCPQVAHVACIMTSSCPCRLYYVVKLPMSPVLCPQVAHVACIMSSSCPCRLYYVLKLPMSPVLCPQVAHVACIMSSSCPCRLYYVDSLQRVAAAHLVDDTDVCSTGPAHNTKHLTRLGTAFSLAKVGGCKEGSSTEPCCFPIMDFHCYKKCSNPWLLFSHLMVSNAEKGFRNSGQGFSHPAMRTEASPSNLEFVNDWLLAARL
ncbi:hypothetical protein RRG08_055368 [Elysia crispata]|uniref:Uncharacterized protein n=1 Tax=Elysia crispata TaxID=231223 RepID=A0AAE1ARQ0_9GAST|nr:hypothetical protein RRG08_055368 [Elysia crispata]